MNNTLMYDRTQVQSKQRTSVSRGHCAYTWYGVISKVRIVLSQT
jgi:hypothetical protein